MSSESEERAAVASASPQGFAPAFTDTLPSTPPPYSDISARTSYKEPLEDTPGIGGAEHSSAKNTILGIAVVDFVRSLLTRIILLDPRWNMHARVRYWMTKISVASCRFLHSQMGATRYACSDQSDEDFCFFHLDCPSLHATTVFGTACTRQVTSDALINKGAHVTRSTVQKAVVVLATRAIFGAVREKLGIVTRAYFAQRDLGDLAVLQDFYETLETSIAGHDDSSLYLGASALTRHIRPHVFA